MEKRLYPNPRLSDRQPNCFPDQIHRRGAHTMEHSLSASDAKPRSEVTPIQFVFIDESSRDSKRLKVTRACESCRRRKVKCDSPQMAHGEPCTSCRKLQVNCVLKSLQDSDKSGDDDTDANSATKESSIPSSRRRSATQRIDQREPPSAEVRPFVWPEFKGVESITKIFGEIDISYDGRAQFVTDRHGARGLPPYSAQSFITDILGQSSTQEDPGFPVSYKDIRTVLPDDDLARHLIDLYFCNIHPYIPILNVTQFCSAWMGDRNSLSPYLLVALFACSAVFSRDPRIYSAKKEHPMIISLRSLLLEYREVFRDAPRLSTIQAELISLKILEGRPNVPGYFYKSWFQLSCVIRLGKDLGLDHMKVSKAQDPDSISARRIWQACLIMDQLMGSAQGREMQLSLKEVDIYPLSENHYDLHRLEASEVGVHNDFLQLVHLIGILRRCTIVHSVAGVKFPFAAEPQYPLLARTLVQWYAGLPVHLRFDPTVDKRLPSHFVAHLHLTYSMVTSVLHRPWVVSTGEYGSTGEWREHLNMCNEASRRATILYEMVLDQYGEHGIRWMIRGNNYAIYGAVIASMIHVVCLTCPEPLFHDGARQYFDRSTRVLDRLCAIHSTPQMQKQISVLKSIFSTDAATAPQLDIHLLPPELASLQAQYSKMQQERQATPHYYHQQPRLSFQSDPGSYDMYPVEQPVAAPSWNPAGLIGAMNMNFPTASIGMVDTPQLQYFTDDAQFDNFTFDKNENTPELVYRSNTGRIQYKD